MLWPTGYDTNAELYQFISKLVHHRKNKGLHNENMVERYIDDNFYAFTMGQTLVTLTNGGGGQYQLDRSITYHDYGEGQLLCNLYVDWLV